MSSYTKAKQVAEYLLERGVSMTAYEMYDEGFRFDFRHKTDPTTIGLALAHLSNSDKYVLEKTYVKSSRGYRRMAIRVTAIKAPAKKEQEPGTEQLAIWRQLLTRKSGMGLVDALGLEPRT